MKQDSDPKKDEPPDHQKPPLLESILVVNAASQKKRFILQKIKKNGFDHDCDQ